MQAFREAGDFDLNQYTQDRFEEFFGHLEKSECGFDFLRLETVQAYDLIKEFRFNKTNEEFVLDVAQLNEATAATLIEQKVDYILFLSQYHIDADIESKQPAHTVYYDLRKADLSAFGAGRATGKLFQSKIQDVQEREQLVLNGLTKKLCQKISKNQ